METSEEGRLKILVQHGRVGRSSKGNEVISMVTVVAAKEVLTMSASDQAPSLLSQSMASSSAVSSSLLNATRIFASCAYARLAD